MAFDRTEFLRAIFNLKSFYLNKERTRRIRPEKTTLQGKTVIHLKYEIWEGSHWFIMQTGLCNSKKGALKWASFL